MKLLQKVGEIILSCAVTASAIVAAALMIVGALGVAIAFGLCVLWDWLEERNRGY